MINNENEFFDAFFKYHAGGDDKLQINLAWPNEANIKSKDCDLIYYSLSKKHAASQISQNTDSDMMYKLKHTYIAT